MRVIGGRSVCRLVLTCVEVGSMLSSSSIRMQLGQDASDSTSRSLKRPAEGGGGRGSARCTPQGGGRHPPSLLCPHCGRPPPSPLSSTCLPSSCTQSEGGALPVGPAAVSRQARPLLPAGRAPTRHVLVRLCAQACVDVHGEGVEAGEGVEGGEEQHDDAAALHRLHRARHQVGRQRLKVLPQGGWGVGWLCERA